MMLVEKNFNKRREDSVKMISCLQKGTRYLQSICGHAKVTEDVALSNKVPLLKKTLETLVFRAKAMLAANNCLDAFELGTLKNKDLKGAEILTQQDEDIEDEVEEEEDEEMGDEDCEEELVIEDANDISEEV